MKCDLHRHLGGSFSPKIIYEILIEQGLEYSLNDIISKMTYKDDNERDFYNFLNKFRILNEIRWYGDVIRMAIRSVCWNIAREKLDYVEIKLSLDKYLVHTGWSPIRLSKFVYDLFEEFLGGWGVEFGLVFCLKYEADKSAQCELANCILESDFADCFVGIDLVGDEAKFDVEFYKPIFKLWKDAGKGLEVHAGESQSAENVRLAISELGVNRVAHGIKIVNHPDIIKLAIDHNVCFDVAPSSNWYTGVVSEDVVHPARKLIDAGCIVTIGTDDPEILCTTLDDEYCKIRDSCSLDDSEIIKLMVNSVEHAFRDFNDIIK